MQKAIYGILSCPALLPEFSQAPKPSPAASRSISNQEEASLRKDMCRYLFISDQFTLLKNSMKMWSLKLIKITPDGSWLYTRLIQPAAHKGWICKMKAWIPRCLHSHREVLHALKARGSSGFSDPTFHASQCGIKTFLGEKMVKMEKLKIFGGIP